MKNMNNRIDFYKIHDIINFAVIDKTGFINRQFDNLTTHYENFKVEKNLNEIDLTIELGKFKPDSSDCYVVGSGEFYIKENYLYVPHESHKGAKWSFEVEGIDKKNTIVRIDCNALGRLFILGNVIDFLIYKKLLDKGYALIHASGVNKEGRGFAFSSRGGGGKTTTTLEMVSNGFDYLGDNYVIINKGNIFSFPTSLNIFTYNLAPIVAKNLTRKERLKLYILSNIYKATMGYAKFFIKINPKRIFDDIPHSSKLQSIFMLMPHSNMPKITITMADREELINRVLYNQMLEFKFFNRYAAEYSYFFSTSKFSQHQTIYEKLLKSAIPENINSYKIIIPINKKIDKNIINYIEKLIGGSNANNQELLDT
jgi:hypothetical protein